MKHVSLAEEHLHDHFAPVAASPGRAARPAQPIMPASLIVEGVAQSGGILVGHASGFRENIVLAKIAKVELDREALPGDSLRYSLTIERTDRQGTTAACEVGLTRPGRSLTTIGRVDLIFSVLGSGPGPAKPTPQHCFVFGEAIRTLIRVSGFESVTSP